MGLGLTVVPPRRDCRALRPLPCGGVGVTVRWGWGYSAVGLGLPSDRKGCHTNVDQPPLLELPHLQQVQVVPAADEQSPGCVIPIADAEAGREAIPGAWGSNGVKTGFTWG